MEKMKHLWSTIVAWVDNLYAPDGHARLSRVLWTGAIAFIGVPLVFYAIFFVPIAHNGGVLTPGMDAIRTTIAALAWIWFIGALLLYIFRWHKKYPPLTGPKQRKGKKPVFNRFRPKPGDGGWMYDRSKDSRFTNYATDTPINNDMEGSQFHAFMQANGITPNDMAYTGETYLKKNNA